jgi:hypothetical protein
MTAKARNHILRQLPEGERVTAGKIIDQAIAFGWTDIGLWTCDAEAHDADLVGNSPAGKFGFLPAVEEQQQEND